MIYSRPNRDLSALDVHRAACLWIQGKDTKSIASTLRVTEAKIASSIQSIKQAANTMKENSNA
jgi:hypothetical protein